jgi:DNA-binding YbaB/EbfC family protein
MDFNDNDSLKMAEAIREKMLNIMNNSSKTLTVSSGGGMVTVVINLRNEIVSMDLEKEVVNPDDIEMLTDLIVAAVNEAFDQVQREISQQMEKIAMQLNFPFNR